MIPGTKVYWYVEDLDARAQNHLAAKNRLETDERYRRLVHLGLADICKDYPIPADIKKTGVIMAIDRQPEQHVAASVGRSNGWGLSMSTRKVVDAKWSALVKRDEDGRIVEMNPTDLIVYE